MEGCPSGRGGLPHATASGLHFICSAYFLASWRASAQGTNTPRRLPSTSKPHSRHCSPFELTRIRPSQVTTLLSYHQP